MTNDVVKIPIRWYRLGRMYGPGMPQDLEDGLQERILERTVDQIGLVSVHCWNLGESDGPYPFDAGTRSPGKVEDWVPSAHAIIRDGIKPAIEAARESGIQVFHLCVDSYARRYPTYNA